MSTAATEVTDAPAPKSKKKLFIILGVVVLLLAGAGVGKTGQQTQGSALASYLLFEAPFTRELMALGEADTLARRSEVAAFFGWHDAPAPQAL